MSVEDSTTRTVAVMDTVPITTPRAGRRSSAAALIRRLAADFARAHPDAVVVRTRTRTVVATPLAAARAGLIGEQERIPARTRATRIRRAASDVLADIHRSSTVVGGGDAEQPALPAGGHALATIQDDTSIATKYALARVLRGLHDLTVPVVVAPCPDALAAVKRTGLDWLAEGLHVVPSLSASQFEELAATAVVLASDAGDPELVADADRAHRLDQGPSSDGLSGRRAA